MEMVTLNFIIIAILTPIMVIPIVLLAILKKLINKVSSLSIAEKKREQKFLNWSMVVLGSCGILVIGMYVCDLFDINNWIGKYASSGINVYLCVLSVIWLRYIILLVKKFRIAVRSSREEKPCNRFALVGLVVLFLVLSLARNEWIYIKSWRIHTGVVFIVCVLIAWGSLHLAVKLAYKEDDKLKKKETEERADDPPNTDS